MRFTQPERLLFLGLIISAAAWGAYSKLVRPEMERLDTLRRVVPAKQKLLEQLLAKSADYRALRAELEDYRSQARDAEKDFEPLTFLEATGKQLQLAQKVSSMRRQMLPLSGGYCEVIVEVKLEAVTLKELVDFLLKVKAANSGLRTTSLHIKKNPVAMNALDAVIEVSTLKLDASVATLAGPDV